MSELGNEHAGDSSQAQQIKKKKKKGVTMDLSTFQATVAAPASSSMPTIPIHRTHSSLQLSYMLSDELALIRVFAINR
jgi:hypothetical protein